MIVRTPSQGWPIEVFVIYSAYIRDETSSIWFLNELTILCIQTEIRVAEKLKKKAGNGGGRKEQPFKGFVNIGLNVERKKALLDWGKDEVELFDLLSELINDYYRVSFAPANDGNAVACAITCRDEASVNAAWCMTSRAPTWQDALRVALWKHFVLCERDWSEFIEGDSEDNWG